jgi:hypothetical protein
MKWHWCNQNLAKCSSWKLLEIVFSFHPPHFKAFRALHLKICLKYWVVLLVDVVDSPQALVWMKCHCYHQNLSRSSSWQLLEIVFSFHPPNFTSFGLLELQLWVNFWAVFVLDCRTNSDFSFVAKLWIWKRQIWVLHYSWTL